MGKETPHNIVGAHPVIIAQTAKIPCNRSFKYWGEVRVERCSILTTWPVMSNNSHNLLRKLSNFSWNSSGFAI